MVYRKLSAAIQTLQFNPTLANMVIDRRLGVKGRITYHQDILPLIHFAIAAFVAVSGPGEFCRDGFA